MANHASQAFDDGEGEIHRDAQQRRTNAAPDGEFRWLFFEGHALSMRKGGSGEPFPLRRGARGFCCRGFRGKTGPQGTVGSARAATQNSLPLSGAASAFYSARQRDLTAVAPHS